MMINLRDENKLVGDRYRIEMNRLAFDGVFATASGKLISLKPDIIIDFPYWVAESFAKQIDLNILRALSLGNLFGALYILAQDKIIDQQESDPTRISETLLVSNIIYYKWMKEYQRAFRSNDYFWALFEKYLNEFVVATLWEKRLHFGKVARFENRDLINCGHKFSLLKISAAGACLAGEEEGKIEAFSELVGNYHIGYQLYDDVVDWREDFSNKNHTYFLFKIYDRLGLADDQEQIENYLKASDLIEQHLSESIEYYSKAVLMAEELKCFALKNFIQKKIKENENFLETDRRQPLTSSVSAQLSPIEKTFDPGLVLSQIHMFQRGAEFFLYQIDHKLATRIDQRMYDFVRFLERHRALEDSHIMERELGLSVDEITEMFNELTRIGVLKEVQSSAGKSMNEISVREKDKNRGEVLVSLGILISNNRNGNADVIQLEIAKQAIDLLFIRSGYITDLFIHLYLGDVIDESIIELLVKIRDYIKKLSGKLFKTVSISINIDAASLCAGLTSKDGDYGKLLRSIRSHFEGEDEKRFVINLLVPQTENQALLKDLAPAFGEAQSNHFQICTQPFCSEEPFGKELLPAESPRKDIGIVRGIEWRLMDHKPYNYFCNAGKSYVVISPDGKYYPCHLFAKAGISPMGSNDDGLLKSQIEYVENDVKSKPRCGNCWLINLCAGGCLFMERVLDSGRSTFERSFCDRYRTLAEEAVAGRFGKIGVVNQDVRQTPYIQPCDNF